MKRPLVALTTTLDLEGGDHRRPSVFLYTSYIAALEYAGLTPVLVTPAHDETSIAALLGAVDGLVLSGGEDVDPARYGEKPRVPLDSVFPARDAAEFAAVQCAVDRGIPILGICRGCQVLNVALGGTLWQDIPTDIEGARGHAQTGGWHRREHHVHTVPGSRLNDIAAAGTICINSFHHQAVRDVAPGLRIAARADDGVIEAIEGTGPAWVLGVQWHPERLEATTPDDDHDRRLFAAFAGAVRAGIEERADIDAGLGAVQAVGA
jgi:putative glutamine amidotransferase